MMKSGNRDTSQASDLYLERNGRGRIVWALNHRELLGYWGASFLPSPQNMFGQNLMMMFGNISNHQEAWSLGGKAVGESYPEIDTAASV